MEIITLRNGIKVVTEKLSYLRTASFGVWVKVGSSKETKENNGISHMIEHMLFKGTKNRTARQLADEIAIIGDDVNAFTGKEVTCYYGTTTTEKLPILIELLSDMICNSTLTKEDIQKEKKVIYEEIDMYDDSADDLVHELLQEKVYKNQALGYIISGTKSNVKSFTRQQLLDFIHLHYRAENILISIAGNFDEATLKEELEQHFGQIPGNTNEQLQARNSLATISGILSPYEKKYDRITQQGVYHSCFVTRHKENEQLHMNIAYNSISLRSKEACQFSVFNSMFGGSNNSRLFQKIREELSLVYSIYSYGSSFEHCGLFHIDILVNPIGAVTVLKEIKKLICEMTETMITEEELNTHKSQIKTELIMSSESSKARMNSNAKGLLLRGGIKTLDELIGEIDAVTCNDILEFANKTFKNCIPSMCLVGPENTVSFRTIRRVFEKEYTKEEA